MFKRSEAYHSLPSSNNSDFVCSAKHSSNVKIVELWRTRRPVFGAALVPGLGVGWGGATISLSSNKSKFNDFDHSPTQSIAKCGGEF